MCCPNVTVPPLCVMYTHHLPAVASPCPVMVRSEVTHWDPSDPWPANTHFSSARTSPLALGSYSLSLVRSVGRMMRRGPGTPAVSVSLWSGAPVVVLLFFLTFFLCVCQEWKNKYSSQDKVCRGVVRKNTSPYTVYLIHKEAVFESRYRETVEKQTYSLSLHWAQLGICLLLL